MTNLAANLVETARRTGERIALKLDETEIPYAALDAASARVAGLLRARGVQPGARIAIMLPTVPQFAVAYYGVLRVGGVVVAMDPLLNAREVKFRLSDSRATVIFAWHECALPAEQGAAAAGAAAIVVTPGPFERLLGRAPASPEVVDAGDEATAVIVYTSGTTDKPQGAELTQHGLARNVEAAIDLFGFDAESVVLGALPLFHAFGQTCAMNAPVASGATLSLISRFDAGRALEMIERDRATVFEGVPSMYEGMLRVPERERFDCSSLRTCVSGGAAMPVELMRGFEAAFGCRMIDINHAELGEELGRPRF